MIKFFYTTALLCFVACSCANAAPKYWVGPLNGAWNTSANWSGSLNGPGGAGVPGAEDSVIFSGSPSSLVYIDVSTTIGSLRVNNNTTIYTSTPTVVRILRLLQISYQVALKDSTSADVSFNLVFDGAAKATAIIYGDLAFEGGVPLSNPASSGATLTAEPGSVVTVLSRGNGSENNQSSFNPYQGYQGGQIISKKNSGYINSSLTSLLFTANAAYLLENNLDILIPVASWASATFVPPSYSGFLHSPEASIIIKGTIDKIKYAQPVLNCGGMIVDLPALNADKDLAIPNGSTLLGGLSIYNTNNFTLTLLANTGAGSTTEVTVGDNDVLSRVSNMGIIGAQTKVALARADPSDAGRSFKLNVWGNFSQSGGNFSLQDYNGATGFSNLELRSNLTQTGGSFFTNSTSTTAKLVVTMANPVYITGPSGSFQSARTITMSSGSIDNAAHNVTLRIDHSVYIINGYQSNLNGVILQTPLQVGKLELVRSPLTTTATNVITVNNPALDAITIGGASSNLNFGIASGATATSYVNGPVRRATNSTQPYFFPTGKGNFYVTTNFQTYSNSFYYDSCYVIPTSSAPSLYQAEYFKTAYPDLNVTAPLLGVSNAEYWDFTKVSGSDAQVKFKMRSPVVSAAASKTLVAAHYENGHWVSAQGSTLLPCAVTDSFIVSGPMSNFSPFTFGYLADASTTAIPANLAPGLAYKVYTGNFNALPDFNAITAVSSGVSNNVNTGVRPEGTDYNYAIKWDGYITITTPGIYTFETVSDDGSKLYFNSPYCLNQASVVSNDGEHMSASATGTINITAAGNYPITITYFQKYSGQTMQVYWTGPGFSRQAIPDNVFQNNGGNTTPPETVTGLKYKYYEGDFNALPDFNALTPLKTGNTPNVDISLRNPGVNDHFAFVWEGTINIPTSGFYQFETISDDGSRLALNGSVLVNNDGLHAATSAIGSITLTAGVYPVSISYFEKDGGESMQVLWTGPGIVRQAIPNGAFGQGTATPNPPATGLSYKYYEGDFNLLPDFSALTPVKTGISSNADITIRPAERNDHFAFVWEGTITIPVSATYEFETISDDGSQVFVNGQLLVNNDGLHAPHAVSASITLPAGVYPIRIAYFDKDGGETLELYWSGGTSSRSRIPDSAFGAGTVTPPAPASSGLNYKYYEGSWEKVPDFTNLTPVKTGISPNVDINLRTPGVNDKFAFMWDGYINIPTAGTYTFETISDDGSRVYFNQPYSIVGPRLVDNDGLHAPTSVSATATVKAPGRYPITVVYFEKDGGETMQLYWSGPGINRQLIPDAAFTTTNTLDGVTTMATPASANGNSMIDGKLMKVYPNPFAESFTVDYYNAGSDKSKVSIGLYDLSGKLIYNYQPSNLTIGSNRWLINMRSKNLLPGIYMAQVKVNGVPVKSIKLIKANR